MSTASRIRCCSRWVADRWEGALDVGHAQDKERRLATRLSELGALAGELDVDEVTERMRRLVEQRALAARRRRSSPRSTRACGVSGS